jgi:CHAD domain-containing protein
MKRPRVGMDGPIVLLRRGVRALFKELPRALAADEDGTHEMRIASRRLRVGLPLLALKGDCRRVRRVRATLRALTRTAGAARDLDVCVGLFEAAASEAPTPSAPTAVLRRRLLAARRRSRLRMVEDALDVDIAGLRRSLRQLLAAGVADSAQAAERVRVLVARERERFVALMDRNAAAFDPDHLHELRRVARRLRYAADLYDALQGTPSEAPRLFKRVQDDLGLIRDAYLLGRWIESQSLRSARRGESALSEAASAEAQRAWARARAHHARFLERASSDVVSRAAALVTFRPAAAPQVARRRPSLDLQADVEPATVIEGPAAPQITETQRPDIPVTEPDLQGAPPSGRPTCAS